MGIKHIKSSEHSPSGKGSIKIGDTFTMTGYDRELQTDVRTDRLTSAVFVVEKGKPYNYTAIGESVVYVIEGEYILEDQTTPAPPLYLTKGDVAITSEGTVVKCSSPSKTTVFGVTHIQAGAVITDAIDA